MLKRYLFFFFLSLISIATFAQGSETFKNIPAANSGYTERTWTGDNGLPWKATDARTDEVVFTGDKAILIREGSLTCNNIPNGITKITFDYVQRYTGTGDGRLEVYINGVKKGETPVTTKDVVASFTLDNIDVNGTFNLEIRQPTVGTTTKNRIAIDNVVWTGYAGTPCVAPTAQPTNLILNATPKTVSGTFTASVPEADNYLILRSTTSTLSSNPVNGTTYSPGQTVGGATVVANTTEDNFTDNNLTPSSQYYYFIFAVNSNCSGGPVYLTNSPLTSTITTPPIPACTTPSSAPASLTLTPATNSIAGSFPAVSGANRYLVIRSLASTLSATPQNGMVYNEGAAFGGGVVVAFNNSTSFNATGLNSNVKYYFFVYAANAECTGEPFYSATNTTANATTIEEANGIPTGYYDGAAGLTCLPLKTKLRDIISTGYVQLSYTPGVWNAYKFTDMRRNDANTQDIIWDIYSDNPNGPEPYTFTFGTNQCGNYSGEGSCYNREHSTPKSWFADAYPMYSDVNHLYPTDGYVNNVRGNYPYGEVSTVSYTSLNGSKLGLANSFGYSGVVFEPINEYKGDLARTSFYMATRYQNEIIANNWAGNGSANQLFLSTSDEPNADKRKLQIYDAWYLKTIWKWHVQDPVSQKEIDRNNAVYYKSGQNNRNPYIDHPEYVALIWECTGILPVTITDLSAVLKDAEVLIKWYATYETNFKQFEIERSTNGTDFMSIGTVQGKNLANYNFTDRNLPSASVAYYRLKMIDIDGKFEYSKIVSVKMNNSLTNNIVVYPNPAKNVLKIQFKTPLLETSQLQIIDLTGRTVMQSTIQSMSNMVTEDVSKLPSGRYLLRIVSTTEVINSSFMIMK